MPVISFTHRPSGRLRSVQVRVLRRSNGSYPPIFDIPLTANPGLESQGFLR